MPHTARTQALHQQLAQRILILDGAMGTHDSKLQA